MEIKYILQAIAIGFPLLVTIGVMLIVRLSIVKRRLANEESEKREKLIETLKEGTEMKSKLLNLYPDQ